MTLVDAGPLVAVIDSAEQDHERCVRAIARDRGPFRTTWPVFTEAMYLLHARAGWEGQAMLLAMAIEGAIAIADQSQDSLTRMTELMFKYRDLPMDFADASLVVLAEQSGDRRILTLDADFRVYRVRDRLPFKIVP